MIKTGRSHIRILRDAKKSISVYRWSPRIPSVHPGEIPPSHTDRLKWSIYLDNILIHGVVAFIDH